MRVVTGLNCNVVEELDTRYHQRAEHFQNSPIICWRRRQNWVRVRLCPSLPSEALLYKGSLQWASSLKSSTNRICLCSFSEQLLNLQIKINTMVIADNSFNLVTLLIFAQSYIYLCFTHQSRWKENPWINQQSKELQEYISIHALFPLWILQNWPVLSLGISSALKLFFALFYPSCFWSKKFLWHSAVSLCLGT